MRNFNFNWMKNAAKNTQTTGGGTSRRCEDANQSRIASDPIPCRYRVDTVSLPCFGYTPGISGRLMKYAAMITLLLTLVCGNVWGASETLTWDGKALAGSGGTNTSAGTASLVAGSSREVSSVSINNSKIEVASQKYDDGYWEDFTCAGCTISTTTNATSTARIEFPITINAGYDFTISGVNFKFEQGGGGGPRVHVFMVQGATSTWLGYSDPATVAWTPSSLTLSAGSAKLVFVLGVASNKNNGRGFKFSAISITGTSAAAGSTHNVSAVTSTGANTYGSVSATSSTVVENGTTTITATPAEGYRVSNWAVSGTGASISPSGASHSTTTTLTMGTADATVTVTFEACPSHTITYTNTKEMDNTANPTSYYEGVGVASFTKLRHAVGYDFTGWSPSSISSSATTNQTIDAQWSANAVAEGTGTLTYAFGYSDNTITTSSITRNNGALYDATNLTWTGVTIDESESAARSGKITTTESYDSSKYLTLTFKIADGYTFTPTEVQLKAVAVTTDKTIRFEFKDNAGTPNTKYLEQVRVNGSDVGTLTYDFDASDPVTLTGTVTVKIYAYGAANSWRLGTPLTITGTVASAAPSCTAPDHVGIDGSWRYFPGQTISLTATGYDDSDQAVVATGYQWQKEVSADNWSNLSNGTSEGITISGATTNNLQITPCGTGNTGNYRCIVSTGATCSTTSSGYGVKIYTLNGAYDDGEFSSNNITFTSGTTGTATVHLAAGRVYKFKVTDNFGKWFGNSGGILEPAVNWDFSSGEDDNCVLFTGPEGDYTFTVDFDHANYGTPEVVVSVAYPSVTHPAAGYAYFKNVDDWEHVGLYMWYADGGSYTDWGSEPWVTKTTTICGDTYYYTPLIPSWYNRVIFREVGGSGQTGNIEYANLAAYSGKYNDKSDANWHDFTTYTISFNAGGGEGTMSSITGICPDADQLLPANTFEKTGYTFAGWEDASGNEYDDEATIEDISDDITLTAQWEVAASLTAISADVLYQAADMANITFTSSDQAFTGLSSNSLFMVYGATSPTNVAAKGKNENHDVTDDISTKNFTSGLYILSNSNTSSTDDPTEGALEIITPSTPGLLYIYMDANNSALTLKKKGTSTSTSLSGAAYKAMAVDANTHYFINGAGSGKRGVYGIQYVSTYAVSITTTNVTKGDGDGTAIKGKAYTATFTANTGYALPDDATVTIGGASKTKGTDYSWSVSKGVGTLSIAGSKVTGAIVVTFTATANTYTVTHTTSNVTETSCPTSATYGTNYSATYSESTGYDLPSTIGVTIGGNDATVDVDYTWSVSNGEGTFAIAGAKITGNIVVSVTGVAECATVLTPDELAIDSKTYNSVTFGWYGPDLPTGTIDYEVYAEVKDDGTKVLDWTSTSGDNDYTVTGLDPNTEYTFKVKAVGNTEGGYCEYSDVATIDGTTNKAPLSLTLTYASLSLTTGDVTAAPTLTGNSGGGAVTYSVTSATPAGCATVVSGTGVVTAVAAGTATVTVNVAAAGDYLAGSTTAVFTISDPCFYADDLKKSSDLGFTAGSTLDATKVSGSITGGAISNSSATATIGGNDNNGLVIDSEDKKVTVTLTSPNIFQAGTVITIGAHVSDKAETGTSKTSGFTVGGNTPTPASKTSESKAEAFTQTYTVVADDGIEGTNHFEIALKSSADKSYICSIKITGCGTASGYTVTYADGGATSGSVPTDASSPYEEGATVTVLGNTGSLAKTGYTFAGWNDGSTDYNAGNTFTMPDENVTLTAQWTEDTHTVSVAAGAHGTVSPSSVSGVGIATASGNITATPSTGYNFSSWDLPSGVTAAAGKTASSNPIQINATADDKTITATWTTVSYTITYILNSGSLDGSQKTSYTIEDDDYDLPTPTYADHVFQGWYAAGDFSGDRVYTLAQGSTGNKNYYAKWADGLTINWTITKVSSKLYKGGTGYTVTAEIDDASWDTSGDKDDLVLSASDGVTLSNITKSINGSGKAQVEANFSVAGDIEDDEIYFTLSVPAAGDYSAIEDEKEVELDDCPNGDVSIRFKSSYKNDAGSSLASLSSGSTQYFGNGLAKMFAVGGEASLSTNSKKHGYRSDRTEIVFKIAETTTLDIYFNSNSTSRSFALYSFSSAKELSDIGTSDYSTKSIITSVTATGCNIEGDTGGAGVSKGVVSISGSSGGIKATYSLSEGYYLLKFESGEGYFYGFDATTSSSSDTDTELAWSESLADKATVNKNEGDDDFQYYASPTPSNAGGPINYTSSDESVATVSSNGTVHILSDGTTTITAAMPAYGCYIAATSITYSLVVANTCSDEPGTIVNNDGSTITGNKVTRGACETLTLKLTGHTGSTIAWKKDGVTIVGATSATYAVPTGESGVYSATVTGTCTLSSSNSITVTTAGGVDPTIFADEFTVKSGRPFHYRLMQLNKGESVSVKSTTSWTENTDFVITKDADNIVYISSKTYAGVTIASAGTETITLTISNECGDPTDKAITIHKIVATAKPTVAWIATGDTKGEKTCKASESTNTTLYEYLEDYYTMTAINCYWSTSEADLVEEYSKYDLIILTDYPNSGTCPNGKSGKSNSYTNAIGLLIDYRPILTFEAFVAGCPNWGIPSDPHNTKTTQKSLTLLCNAKDIFGNDDGTFAAGAAVQVTTASSGQALQGFDVSSTPNFVFIGKITDSDSKEYVACCERQVNTGARMVVFGLNSAIMSSMTDNGKLMVQKFVDYLLEADAASIPDCSVIFKGTTDSDWYTTSNWESGELPNDYASVRIDAPCVVPYSTNPAKAGSIKIHQGGAFTGSLTIEPKGRMIVEKTITRIVGDEYTVHMPTEASDLVVETSSDGNGVLIMGSYDGTNKATVGFYTKAKKTGGHNVNQFIGTPFNDENNVINNYYGTKLYEFRAAHDGNMGADNDWQRLPNDGDMRPFYGYNILTSQASERTLWMEGTLVASEDQKMKMYYNGSSNTENMFANSWPAPIDIAQFTASDFGGGVATVYIFNAGTLENYQAMGDGSASATSPGQYIVLPVASAPWTSPTVRVIPSMQAFSVFASGSNQTLTLDYDRLVRTRAATMDKDSITTPTRAPRRAMVVAPVVMHLRVDGLNGYATNMHMLERADLTDGFDNGWDGHHMVGDEDAPQLYAITEAGKMNVNCVPNMEGTVLGFRAGTDNQFTFSFGYEGDEDWYLNDLKEQQSTLIDAMSSYTFMAEPEDAEARFVISRTPIHQTPTGVESGVSDNNSVVARKLIINDKVYIIRGGQMYSVDGALVVPMMEQR